MLNNKNKTFKPVKSHGASSTKRHKLSEYAKATLGSGNMRQAVVLPKGEDVNEWLAVNTVDFFNEISLLYGTITEFCLPTTCPVMCAGPHYQYLWADTTGKYKQPVKFIYFVNEFKLIDVKELEPLKDLIDSLMGKEATAQLTAAGSSKGQRGSGIDEEQKSEGDLSEGRR